MNDSMNTHTYTVSAVIPAYNCQDYIKRCINSVLAQTQLPDEIIVVNDGSTDKTLEILDEYIDKITVITQPNSGEGAARNTGIRSAKSDFIAFLDSDDEWLPDYIQTQMQILENNHDLVWVAGNFKKCLCSQQRQAPDYPAQKFINLLGSKEYFDSYFIAFINKAHGCSNTMVVSRKVLIETGMFKEGLKIGADIDMWLRIAYKNPKIGFNPQPLSIYHIDIPTSAMHQQRPIDIYMDFIDRHINHAKENNMFEQFKPAGAFIAKRWVRGFLFSNRGRDIKLLINSHPELYSMRYRFIINILATFPGATAAMCRFISTLVRKLGLSKQIKNPPPK